LRVAFARFWSKAATFSGRASRSEYWWTWFWQLIVFVVLVGLARIGNAGVEDAQGRMVGANGIGIAASVLLGVFLIATIIPNLAVTFRRLHDANLSGFFILLGLIAGIGGVVLLVFALLPSNPLGARFDAKPK
jgi:uncharacterized membrane protein YhaH (DUF805 family)